MRQPAGELEDWKTGEDWGQKESFLAFQQLDKFEGNIPSVPDFPDFRTRTSKANLVEKPTALGYVVACTTS